ncbi:hypothetical protein JZ751_024904 [Albula glossodonta]|uniref:Uncharacterized protein n=1 Tax=Albula glossodonta TaxID=121402 RepID=A0A8T2PER3_9TELE|nr:hypothetical protein JZ751_024904 [Albula glossodonta]
MDEASGHLNITHLNGCCHGIDEGFFARSQRSNTHSTSIRRSEQFELVRPLSELRISTTTPATRKVSSVHLLRQEAGTLPSCYQVVDRIPGRASALWVTPAVTESECNSRAAVTSPSPGQTENNVCLSEVGRGGTSLLRQAVLLGDVTEGREREKKKRRERERGYARLKPESPAAAADREDGSSRTAVNGKPDSFSFAAVRHIRPVFGRRVAQKLCQLYQEHQLNNSIQAQDSVANPPSSPSLSHPRIAAARPRSPPPKWHLAETPGLGEDASPDPSALPWERLHTESGRSDGRNEGIVRRPREARISRPTPGSSSETERHRLRDFHPAPLLFSVRAL